MPVDQTSLLQEVVSIRNRLGTIIITLEPRIGKEWKMFNRIVNAHSVLMGIEIDKNTPVRDEKQPLLPGMPKTKDNICPICSLFASCGFEIRKQGGVSDCESYQLKSPESPKNEQGGHLEGDEQLPSDPGENSIKTHEFTTLDKMPHTELSPEEQAKLTQIKNDVENTPVSLATFNVDKTATADDKEHTVSMCGTSASHKTLKGAVIMLFQELGFPCQTPDQLKEALMKFPESDKRDLIISFLEPDAQAEEKKRTTRRKKTDSDTENA
jgi:hypothetical protein